MTDVDLNERLAALGEPTRFRLLGMLNQPRTAGEIHLETRRGIPEGRRQRSMTRQGVRYHLSKLQEANLVHSGTTDDGGREVTTYRASPQGLFLMLEQLRAYAEVLARGHPASKAESPPPSPPVPGPWQPQPRLVVVRGLSVGQSFPLEGKTPEEDRGWVVGRDEDVEIALSWDPFMDPKNAEIVPTSSGYRVMDLRSADTRVTVNDQPLDRGAEADLQRGDLVQMGLSALLYQGP